MASMWLLLLVVVASYAQDDNLDLVQQHPRDGTDLGGGIYTRSNVDKYAQLSQQVVALRNLDLGQRQDLYRHGNTESQFVLSSLIQGESPTTAFFANGLVDLRLSAAARDGYVNSVVESHLADDNLVQHAILALPLWQYASHLLYQGALLCHAQTEADNPSQVNLGIDNTGLEEFVAVWIGIDQTVGSTNGPSLYAWAQNQNGVESFVNQQIKLQYQQAAAVLALPNACTAQNHQVAALYWTHVVELQRIMIIPLYRRLWKAMDDKDANAVDLYIQALVPHLSQCRPDVFAQLYDVALEGNARMDFAVLRVLVRQTYDCWGWTCRELEDCEEEDDDDSDAVTLAGFTTLSDVRAVRVHGDRNGSLSYSAQLSRTEYDIYQMQRLSQLNLDLYATMLYRYGRHVYNDDDSLSSLHARATSASRRNTAFYQDLASYHERFNEDYGDTAILQALAIGQSTRAAYLCAYQVVLWEILGHLQIAFDVCEDSDSSIGFANADNPIDQVAALWIGSMQSNSLYGLAHDLAFDFGQLQPQSDDGTSVARINQKVQDVLYAAKGELDALDCVRVQRSVEQLQQYLLVPLLQALLTTFNEERSRVIAWTVLPLIDDDDDVQRIIHQEWIRNPSPDLDTVGDALGMYWTTRTSLSCASWLGQSTEVDPCRYVPTSSSSAGGMGNVVLLWLQWLWW